MSELQDLLVALDGVTKEAEQHAAQLVQHARQLGQAASSAASATQGSGRADSKQTAAALQSAQRSISQAAQHLHQAALAGKGFVARYAGGGAGGNAPRGPESLGESPEFGSQSPEFLGSTGSAFDHSANDPSLPEGVGYASASGRPLFPSGPLGYNSAQQGNLGDCFFIASLAAVAGAEPDTLRGSLVRNADGSIGHGLTTHADTLPTTGDGDEYGTTPDGSSWVGHFEKSYADTLGGYDKLGEGGWPSDALGWITGREPITLSTSSLDDISLTAALSTGRPAVASTPGPLEIGSRQQELAKQYGVVWQGAHAYAVTGVDTDGNVNLYNPWGQFHPKPMPIDVFRELYWRVDAC